MARYLFYLSPQTGHLYPLVPTMQELVARGHTVTVYGHAPGVAALAELGVTVLPVDAGIGAIKQDDWQGRNRMEAHRREIRVSLDRAPLEVTDLRAAIDRHDPDVLVVDPTCWGAGAAAQASGRPWAWAATWTLIFPSRDAPPNGLGLPPRTDPFWRLVYADAWRHGLKFWQPFVHEVNELRAGLGLAPVHTMGELWSETADICLIYTAEPLEYPRRDWPSSVRLVGPGVWTPPAPPPAWLAQVSTDIVLVTCSTQRQQDIALIETTLRALANEDVFVVATTAGADGLNLDVPANARVEAFLPHGPVVARASCVVCHGGLGLVQTALMAGVPVCAVPFGRDQPEVAMRVQVAGVGVRLPARRLNPARLRNAVFRAMAMRERARAVGDQLRQAGGPQTAATILESLLR